MSAAVPAPAATEGGDPYEQRVTPLELFFDLVFVFALTQVTGFLADHLSWAGMVTRDFSGEPLSYWVITVVYVWQPSTSQRECRRFRSRLRAANFGSRRRSHYHPVCRGGSGGIGLALRGQRISALRAARSP